MSSIIMTPTHHSRLELEYKRTLFLHVCPEQMALMYCEGSVCVCVCETNRVGGRCLNECVDVYQTKTNKKSTQKHLLVC